MRTGAAAIRRAAVAGLVQVGCRRPRPAPRGTARPGRAPEGGGDRGAGRHRRTGQRDALTAALSATTGRMSGRRRRQHWPARAACRRFPLSAPRCRTRTRPRAARPPWRSALSGCGIGRGASRRSRRPRQARPRGGRSIARGPEKRCRGGRAVRGAARRRPGGEGSRRASALRSFEWYPAGARQHAVHAVLHGQFTGGARKGGEAMAPLIVALAERDAASRRGAADALGALDDSRVVHGARAAAGRPGRRRARGGGPVARPGGVCRRSELVRTLGDPTRARRRLPKLSALIGERLVASAIMAALLAGQPARHGGLALRVVGDRDALDKARRAADLSRSSSRQLRSKLPSRRCGRWPRSTTSCWSKPGQRPDPDERVACDEVQGRGPEGA